MPLSTIVRQIARGFVMGSADIVPGVSGGTVALVLGIYGRLIENIQRGASALRSLLSRDGSAAISKATSVEWGWLLSLLAGILIAIATLSALLERLLEEHAIRTSAVFLGLIAGSIVVASQLIRDRNAAHIAIAVVAAAALFFVAGSFGCANNPESTDDESAVEQELEEAGAETEDAAEEAAEETEEAAEEADEEMDEAVEDTEEGVDEMGDEIDEATEDDDTDD